MSYIADNTIFAKCDMSYAFAKHAFKSEDSLEERLSCIARRVHAVYANIKEYRGEEVAENIWESIQCVGNTRTGTYHELSCKLIERIGTENMVGFRSAYEAEKAGYKPCLICRPTLVVR